MDRDFLFFAFDVAVGAEALQTRAVGKNLGREVGADAATTALFAFFTQDFVHVVVEKELNARLACGVFEAAHENRAGRARGGFERSALRPREVQFARRGAARTVGARIVGLFVEKRHADPDEPVIGRNRVVGDHVSLVPIVEAVVGKAVRESHGPVDEVLEEGFGRVFDPVLLLRGRAPAEKRIALRNDGVAADVVVGVYDQGFESGLGRADRDRNAGGAGADHDDVGFKVPFFRKLRGGGGGTRKSGHHAADGGRTGEKTAAGKILRHKSVLLRVEKAVLGALRLPDRPCD